MDKNGRPAVGFIGFGDQGLPMAVAIAESGYALHVGVRRPGSLEALCETSHVVPATTKELGGACEIVGLCVSTDDTLEIVSGGLLHKNRSSSITARAHPKTRIV